MLVMPRDVCAHVLTTTFMASESASIPKNPRTDRPVGYAFVDLSTPTEAERAIAELSGKEILERKVSVQLARKPEPAAEKVEGTNGEGSGEGARRRQSTRGRGRAGRGRAGRARGGRSGTDVSCSTEFPVYKHPTDPPGNRMRRRRMSQLPPRSLKALLATLPQLLPRFVL